MGNDTPFSTDTDSSMAKRQYKVSITMDCPREQLDYVLSQLADVGSGLTIKID